MFERPSMSSFLASWYSWSRVRPFWRLVPERCPPRRDEDMSLVDVFERVRDSPERARSLLTVRAAISSARLSERPCSFWLSLMCSYWRGTLLPLLFPPRGLLCSFP